MNFSSNEIVENSVASGTTARNKPLNRSACRPKWKSDVPITDNQLRRKREEYWDTGESLCRRSVDSIIRFVLAPAFEGRKEIWDALRGACYAIEQNDINLAQSSQSLPSRWILRFPFVILVINCANISLPHGTLLDCYDELGTRYQLPVYVLSPPTNLIDGEQSSVHENESNVSEIDLVATNLADRERDLSANRPHASRKNSGNERDANPVVREIKKHRRKQKSTVDSSENESSSTPSSLSTVNATAADSAEIPIKFRLSNGKEHRLYCKPNEKIRNVKKRLAMLENGAIDSHLQRLFFGGKVLRKYISSISLLASSCRRCFRRSYSDL